MLQRLFVMGTATLALVALGTDTASAQWAVTASVGENREVQLPAETGLHSALGLFGTLRDGDVRVRLYGGVPFAPEQDESWLAAGATADRRWGDGRIRPTLRIDMETFGYRDPVLGAFGGGGIGEGLAGLSTGSGDVSLRLEAGARGAWLTTSTTTASTAVPMAAATIEGSRGALKAELVADAQRVEGLVLPRAGARASLRQDRWLIWAGASRWLADAFQESAWHAGAQLQWGRYGFFTQAGRTAPDPLFWNPGRRTWTVGVSRSLGSRTVPTDVVPATKPGNVVLEVPVTLAPAGLAVAGEFSDWEPLPLRRDGEVWHVALDLAPGVYHYAYVREDGSWFVPEDAPGRRSDGMGGHVALLIVSEP